LVAFGETSISTCNDSHSSQATSTLGNTPNLNIEFLHQKETLHWFIRAGLLYRQQIPGKYLFQQFLEMKTFKPSSSKNSLPSF